jgi:hypothetical protein
MISRRTLIEVVDILASLVRNIQLRRALSAACAEPHLNFWRVIYGDLTDLAVLEWCKLFGSDDEERQPLHWKNVVGDHNQFRSALFSALSISAIEWSAYWTEMKRYRDQAVAHYDPRRSEITNYPKFDLALGSAYVYYSYVVSELRKVGIEQIPADLEEYSNSFALKCKVVAIPAVDATKEVEADFY